MKIPGVYETNFTTELMLSKKPFVLCGAGVPEMGILNRLKRIGGGEHIICLLEKDGGSIWGMPVISLGDLLKMEKDTMVIISMTYAPYRFYQALSQNGFTNIYSETGILLSMIDPYIEESRKTFFYKKEITENESNINMARSLLADERSKQIFDARLHAYQTDDWGKLENLWEPSQYFAKDIIRLEKGKEVFVDCGSFDFANSMEFIIKTESDYKHIYAFEMYAPFMRSIELLVDAYGVKNVSLFDAAVGDRKRKTMLHADLLCPGIFIDGTMPCQMDSLDNILYNLPDRPTFIKTDIEGMDAHAVKGAKKIIQRDKPKLAISIYHMLGHLWQVPLMIHEFEPSYKLYIRHHERTIWETVCYAIVR